jgi:multidrug efflux pump subunit AcrA (membrane-fusion protein)
MPTFIKKNKILAIVLGVAAIGLVSYLAFGSGSASSGATVSVKRQDLVRTVKISGKVVAAEDASLGFEVGGTVAGVYKKVGDTVNAGDLLVTLDSARTSADLLKAKADLASAEAELARLEGSGQFEAKTASSKASAIQAVDDAYSNADDAIRNKVDQFFVNPDTSNPEIMNAFTDNSDLNLKTSINTQRVIVKETLSAWKASRPDAQTARKYLSTISSFLNLVARAVNIFETNSSLSQTTIDKYKSDVALARQNVNSSLSGLISADDSLSQSLSDVPVQQAKVAAAKAAVQSIQADLSRTVLVSPIAGVVSRQDAKVGQAISPNVSLVAVISKEYRIDAYVPEVLIAGVSLGNPATSTLDAYGLTTFFPAKISHIDPAETIRDGVSNYKVELSFASADERVRSGMTANVDIETFRKAGALVIPLRSIVSKNGTNSVFVQTPDDTAQKTIGTGMSDSDGNVEVLSGLAEGDVILLNPTAVK